MTAVPIGEEFPDKSRNEAGSASHVCVNNTSFHKSVQGPIRRHYNKMTQNSLDEEGTLKLFKFVFLAIYTICVIFCARGYTSLFAKIFSSYTDIFQWGQDLCSVLVYVVFSFLGLFVLTSVLKRFGIW